MVVRVVPFVLTIAVLLIGLTALSGPVSPTVGARAAVAASGSARPGFGVPMHHRDWTAAGSIVVEKLASGSAYISISELADQPDGGFVLFRSGRCYAELPPPSRSIHPYQGGEGEFPVAYATMRRTAFTVELVAKDGHSISCGRHAGREALPANVWGVQPTGHTRRIGGALVFSGGGVSVTVTLASGGNGTRVRAASDWGGSDGTLAHLRPGSCRHVSPGRETPMTLDFDGDSHALADVVLVIPFSRILAQRTHSRYTERPWASRSYAASTWQLDKT